MSTPAVTPNPYAEFQQPAQTAAPDPYAEFQAPAQPTLKPPAQPGNAFTSGDFWGTAKANFNAGTQHPAPPTSLSDVLSPTRALQSFGANVGDVGRSIYHAFDDKPHQTLQERADALTEQGGQQVHNFVHDPVATIAGQVGQATPMLIGGELGGAALRDVASKLPAIGEGMQGLAGKNLTRILQQTPTMAGRSIDAGIDPGTEMLRSGIGPTATRGSLFSKVGGAKEATGSMIDNAVRRADTNVYAPTITPETVRPAIQNPINSALERIDGPGGTSSPAPFNSLSESFNRPAPRATAPISGPNAPEEIPPSDLWKTLRNIDQNTKFNTDPEVESVNETRRDIRGSLRPILESTDPTIRPLSRQYSGLVSASDALERQNAIHNADSLFGSVKNLKNATLPNTLVSSGLYKAGGLLRGLGGEVGPSSLAFSPKMATLRPSLPSEGSIPTGYGEDFTQGGFPQRAPITTPAPPVRLQLPVASLSSAEVQPMVGVRASSYPPLAQDFARTRLVPTKFASPEAIPSRTFEGALDGLKQKPRGLFDPVPPNPFRGPKGVAKF